ncbi:hypothetical protein BDQ17DRAFT_1496166 [Cyathus striatus]|nr:hypothetical protein BDQ17DRAFT_1496166 [Cyathus striatus]
MFLTTVLLLASYLAHGNAAAVTTVTLHNVELTSFTYDTSTEPVFPTQFFSYSPVGVGLDGLTTYVEEIRHSQNVLIEEIPGSTYTNGKGSLTTVTGLTRTSTIDIPTETYYATLVEGASEFKYVLSPTAYPIGQETDCHWSDDGVGECELKVWHSRNSDSTYVETYTGTVVPAYTLVVSDIPGQATSSSHASPQVVVGASASLLIMVATFFITIYNKSVFYDHGSQGCLPNVLDDDSVRVDSNGEAIIQDITISTPELETMAVKSSQLESLLMEKWRKENTIKQTEKAVDALATYISTMNISNVPPTDTRSVMQHYNEVIIEFEEDLIRQRMELDQRLLKLAEHRYTTLELIPNPKKKVSNLYTRLLSPKKLARLRPIAWKLLFTETYLETFSAQAERQGSGKNSYKSRARRAVVYDNPEDANAIATFEVPESKTILGDGTAQKATVAELELDGELKWVNIPTTKDVRMHWTAIVYNDSEYPLLKSAASVYVNGSFTARSKIPYVSPQERFNCALGSNIT